MRKKKIKMNMAINGIKETDEEERGAGNAPVRRARKTITTTTTKTTTTTIATTTTTTSIASAEVPQYLLEQRK